MIKRTLWYACFFIHFTNAQSLDHPYQTNWKTDATIFSAGVATAFGAYSIDKNSTSLSAADILSLNKNDINPLDRFSAGWYSHDQSIMSDILVGGAIVSPLLFIFDTNVKKDIETVATMYLETILFAAFIPSFGKRGVQRIRPFVYGTEASLADKQDIDALRSFFSGHATWAFATSIFFASVYSDFHPNSEKNNYVWAGAIGLASTISILRVTSGAHFLSDIVVGAAVGSSIGYLIPYIHRHNSKSISIFPTASEHFRGFTFSVVLN